MLRFLPLLLWVGCAYRLGPPKVSYGTPVQLDLVQPSTDHSRWYVPIEVNGKPQLLFVDTGYSFTTCDDGLIALLDLDVRGSKKLKGEVGTTVAEKAVLPPFQLGDHTVEGLVCMVRDLGSTSSIRDPKEIPVAGVLGVDLLRRFRTEIAPDQALIRLSDPGEHEPIKDGESTVAIPREGFIGTRVSMPLQIGEHTVWPIVDTGAANTYVDGEHLGLTPSFVQQDVTIRGSGGTGSTVTDRAYYERADLKLGTEGLPTLTLTQRNRTVTTDGLLGLDILNRFRVELDFETNRARLTPTTPAPIPRWSSYSGSPQLVMAYSSSSSDSNKSTVR